MFYYKIVCYHKYPPPVKYNQQQYRIKCIIVVVNPSGVSKWVVIHVIRYMDYGVKA